MMIVCGVMIFVGVVLIYLWLRGAFFVKQDDIDWNRPLTYAEELERIHPYKDSIIIPITGMFLIALGIIQIIYLV